MPFDSVLAAIIETEAMLNLARAQQAREEINKLLLHQVIRDTLLANGIDPLEAKARISSLSDAEVVCLADQINKLPAGGGSGPIHEPVSWPVFIAIVLAFAVLSLIFLYVTNNLSESNWEKSESSDIKKTESYEQPD